MIKFKFLLVLGVAGFCAISFINEGHNIDYSSDASVTYSLTRTSNQAANTLSTTTSYNDANMINYNIETGETTYEYFDKTSYDQKSTLSTSTSDVEVCESYTPDSSSTNASTLSIIGSDDRTSVSNTKTFPYRATALIIVKYKVKNSSGSYTYFSSSSTGSLIAKAAVLTAAHSVYKDVTTGTYDDGIDNPCFPYKIEIYAGLSNSSEISSNYKYYALGTVVNIQKEYYESTSTNYDWATIELDRNLGNSTGYMGFISNWYEKGAEIHSYGYPGDKSNYTMWETYGTLTGSTTYKYKYNIDTYNGQSGSPVSMTNDDGVSFICAVHTTGSSTYNLGTRINTFIFHYLRSYRKSGINVLSLSIVSKSSGTWKIKISNSSSEDKSVTYNTKMCFASDAENRTNLTNLTDITIKANSYKNVQISENWFATSIVASYVEDSSRYIIYANNLNKTTKTLSQYTNIINAQ